MADSEAILTTPYTYTVAKRQVESFHAGYLQPPLVVGQEIGWAVVVYLKLIDNSDAEVSRQRFRLEGQAAVESFLTAIDTALPGETGGVLRRANYRVLTWMLNNGLLPDVSSVTP